MANLKLPIHDNTLFVDPLLYSKNASYIFYSDSRCWTDGIFIAYITHPWKQARAKKHRGIMAWTSNQSNWTSISWIFVGKWHNAWHNVPFNFFVIWNLQLFCGNYFSFQFQKHTTKTGIQLSWIKLWSGVKKTNRYIFCKEHIFLPKKLSHFLFWGV